jgi:hypothetical protein
MTSILRLFLKDTYDIELPEHRINNIIANGSSLKIQEIYNDPLLKKNLIFRHLWKSITGVYPPRVVATFYMNSDKFTEDVKDVLKLLVVVNPIYNFIKPDLEMLSKVYQEYIVELTSEVKKALCLKFAFRFGVHMHEIDTTQNIYNIYKQCVLHPQAWKRISKICVNTGVNIEPPTSIIDYYEKSKELILQHDFTSRNVFTDYINKMLNFSDDSVSIFDSINMCCFMDGTFYRSILGTCVLNVNIDVNEYDKIDTLIHTTNKFIGSSKNLIIFAKDKKKFEKWLAIKEDLGHIHVFSLPEQYLLNYVPKIAQNFINIDCKVNEIQDCILSTNTVSSLFYYIGDNCDSYNNTICDNNIKSTLKNYNRVIVSDEKYIQQFKRSNKHVYVIPCCFDKNDLISKDFVEHQWNAHLQHTCPYSVWNTPSYHPQMNVLLYDQFLLRYIHKIGEDGLCSVLNDCDDDNKHAIVAVDNRENIFTVIAVLVSLYNLERKKWKLIMVCNKKNIDFYKKYFGNNASYITDFYLPSSKFVIDNYNDMLKNPIFWKTLKKNEVEKVLFVQDDGMLVKKGMEKEFFEYDYVGSPWNKEWKNENPNKYIFENINPQLVGNGGVSLRNVKKMEHCCEKYKNISKQLHYDRLQQQPEDVFFSYCCMQEKMNIPGYDIARKFAAEQVWDPKSGIVPYGFHKPWVYHGVHSVNALFTSYL